MMEVLSYGETECRGLLGVIEFYVPSLLIL